MLNIFYNKILLFVIVNFACSVSLSAKESSSNEIASSKVVLSLKDEEAKDKQYVIDLVSKVMNIINGNSDDKKKSQELSDYLAKNLAIDWLCRKVFAKHKFNTLTDEKKNILKKYLQDYLLEFYAKPEKLEAMKGSTFNVNKTTAKTHPLGGATFENSKDRSTKVTTYFVKNGVETKIEWIVSGLIYYIVVEGVNQLISLKSELNTDSEFKKIAAMIK